MPKGNSLAAYPTLWGRGAISTWCFRSRCCGGSHGVARCQGPATRTIAKRGDGTENRHIPVVDGNLVGVGVDRCAGAGLEEAHVTTGYDPKDGHEENGHHGFLVFGILLSLVGIAIGLTIFLLFKEQIIANNSDNGDLLRPFVFLIPILIFIN